jgi:uncharacterized protein YgiB involved in biofilm formation
MATKGYETGAGFDAIPSGCTNPKAKRRIVHIVSRKGEATYCHVYGKYISPARKGKHGKCEDRQQLGKHAAAQDVIRGGFGDSREKAPGVGGYGM